MSDETRAFPGESRFDERRGMTLRDWFAGQALAGLGEWYPVDDEGSYLVGSMLAAARAKRAYEIADAMLEARKTKP